MGRAFESFFATGDFPDVDLWWQTLVEKIPIGYGRYSTAYLVMTPNKLRYIVRITPVLGIQERAMLQHEIKLYERLQKDPRFLQHVSELLYADYPTKYHGKETQDSAYFIFRYVEGLPLDTLLQSFQKSGTVLTLSKLQDWMRQLLETVEFLQRNGVVHRDIKAANLFVDTTHDRLVIFDFGSACITGQDCKSYQFYGTRAYAAPDALQLLGHFPQPYEYTRADDLHAVYTILKKDMRTLVAKENLAAFEEFTNQLGV